MSNRIMVAVLGFFVLGMSGHVTTLGQSTEAKRVDRARQVKEKIARFGTGRSAVVKLKLYNDTEYKGYVSRTGDNDFDIVDAAGLPHTVSYADVRSIGGKNLSSGAKLAIGIGIGAGVTLAILFAIAAHLD